MDLLSEAERLERLARDLRVMHANGGAPTPLQLEGAPLLTDWETTRISAAAPLGLVDGHPQLGARRIQTSAVWLSADRWARTLSRFYRLEQRRGG